MVRAKNDKMAGAELPCHKIPRNRRILQPYQPSKTPSLQNIRIPDRLYLNISGKLSSRIDRSRIDGDIGQVINGDLPGRESDAERVFFCPLGLGSEDIALATSIYRRAVADGLGVRLPFGPSQSTSIQLRL